MSYWLDIVGSFIIGGFIFLILANINLIISSSSSELSYATIVQSDLSNILDIVEYDFYKMGYRISDNKITLAEKKKIKFALDIDDDGSSDSLYYYLGTTSELSITKNPDDKLVYRVVNSNSPEIIGRVRHFHLYYYDSTGNRISFSSLQNESSRRKIRSIDVKLVIESVESVDSVYIGAELRRKISPKNL